MLLSTTERFQRAVVKLHWLHFCDVCLVCVIRCLFNIYKIAMVGFVAFFPDFLNVSPNKLPERLQSHIGCICKISILSDFSNISSNLKCIVALTAFVGFLFSKSFQKFLQICCVNRYIVALVAFVRFLSSVSFQIHPQISHLILN